MLERTLPGSEAAVDIFQRLPGIRYALIVIDAQDPSAMAGLASALMHQEGMRLQL